MKRFAIIEGGTVANIAKAAEPLADNWIEATEGAEIGGTYDPSNGFSPAPEPTLENLRARASLPKDDFILAALDAGVLTEADAEEATTGWPTSFNAFFEGQPDRDRIEAKARWASATSIKRDAPLIERLRVYKNLTPEQVDGLFGINP